MSLDPARTTSLPPRFRVLSQLGHGAQGAVYEALDLESNLRVALKLVAIARPEQLIRFKREFRAVRDLRHPHLVQLHELSEHAGQWFFTMELVDGVDFVTWVRGPRPEPADPSDAPTALGRPSSDPDSGPVRAPSPPELVDRRPAFDEARLRQGLRSLAGALLHIHRAGKVHRDLKPSNVLVTHEGRLVLIDFGVVAELGDLDSDTGLVIGTSVYMAPEQARAEPADPAADWYSFGVLLYEALTGRPPFVGRGSEVVRHKCDVDAPRASLWVDDLPADLEALCARLLDRDPAARPGDDELAALLGIAGSDAGPLPAAAGFVGRDRELAALADAWSAVRAGQARAVLVEGPSGVGKSELTARFLRQLGAREPRLLVLAGRCHEQERVPYNALDAVVDRLARFLAARRPDKVAPLLPPGIAALAQLFPALRTVEAIAARSLGGEDAGGAQPADRSLAFAALRALLSRVAYSRPTVVAIDDLQWADADSQLLLGELWRAPAPPLLLLATARPPVPGALFGPSLLRLGLGGLRREDALVLARALLAEQGAPAQLDAEALVDEAEGHPLFLDALVRHATQHPDAARGRTLNDAIFARAAAFAPPARALLSLIAVAGAPIAQGVAADAAELGPGDFVAHVTALRAARLVRTGGTRREDTIEPDHDRVRETIYARLESRERARLHLALATALEARGAGDELLFGHFDHAGHHVRAARHAAPAAAAAMRALAFDRAAELYRRAVALAAPDVERQRPLLAALGDALTHSGRPREAAEAFLRAASSGVVARGELLDLRRRAVEQLLMGGHLEPGLEATRALLADFDIKLPGALNALPGVAFRQARLAVRPLRWRARSEAELGADACALSDVHWSVGAGLGLVDSVRGMYFVLGGALVALDLGEPFRIARALSMAAIAEAGLGSRWRARRLVDACRRAADAHGSERARLYAEMAEHGTAFLLDNDWPGCLRRVDEAMRLWRASGRTEGWESDANEQFACWSLDNMGRLRAIAERVPARIRAAQHSGNRFMEVNFRAYFTHVHLAPDRAAEARRDVEEAIGSWTPGHDAFGNQHFLAQRSLTYVALYAGDVDAVAPSLERGWRRFFGSLMRHVLLLRQDGLTLHGQLALARAATARGRGQATAARALAATARRALARLERVRLPMAQAAAPRLRAGLAAFEGDPAAAVRALRDGLCQADTLGAALHVAAIRLRLGEVIGGSAGAELRAAALAWMAEEGIKNPARLTAALLPGWPHPG